jgi:intermediate peptidase
MFQGLFGVPELRSHEGFYAMKERAVWETDKLVAESCSPNRLSNYAISSLYFKLAFSLCPTEYQCVHKTYRT